MLYYNRSLYGKVLHTKDCIHIKCCSDQTIGSYENLNEALQENFCICSNCNPLKPFATAMKEATKNPRYRRFDLQDHKTFIRIFSAYSEWRLVLLPSGDRVQLYHKNEFKKPNDTQKFMQGFHWQDVHYNTLDEYLDYIIEHDWYRTLHPANHPPKAKKPPKQWTPKYKAAQKKAKNRAKRQSVRNVLSLIDSLQLQPAIS